MDGNWIALNRKLWDCFLWDFENPKYCLCWIDMLLMANYKDRLVVFNGQQEIVSRGSFVTSMVKLAERWKMDRKTVKRFLDMLKNDGMITYTCHSKKTVVNIVKYGVYQFQTVVESTTEWTGKSPDEWTGNGTADSPQHNKVNNKINKKKDPKGSKEKAERFSPPPLDDVREYCRTKNLDVDPERFVDYYNSNGWKVGKTGMKDWKATVRNWSRSQRQESTAKTKQIGSFNNFDQREYDYTDLERQLLSGEE